MIFAGETIFKKLNLTRFLLTLSFNRFQPYYCLFFYGKSEKPKGIWHLAFMKHGCINTEPLKIKKIRIILFSSVTFVSGWEFRISEIDNDFWNLMEKEESYFYIGKEEEAKIGIYCNDLTLVLLSQEEKLKYGWVNRLNWEWDRQFKSCKENPQLLEERELVKTSNLHEFFIENENSLKKIYWYFFDFLWKKNRHPADFLVHLEEALADAPFHSRTLLDIFFLALFSYEGTEGGIKVPYLDGNNELEFFRLIGNELGKNPEIYWERFPFDLYPCFNNIGGNRNFPVNIRKFVATIPAYKGDLENGDQIVINLLKEATTLKQWTIPFGAYVQVHFGPIRAIKLFEYDFGVQCILVDEVGDFFLTWVYHKNCTFFIPVGQFQDGILDIFFSEDDKKNNFEEVWKNVHEISKKNILSIELILAAIVRDFWIVEDRERIFGASIYAKKNLGLRGDRNEKRYFYLPRIKYVGSTWEHINKDLDYKEREPFFVSGHLRRALHASDKQILLARRFNIVIPEGFTFVRPYYKGDINKDTIYRSRSVLQLAQTLEPVSNTGKDDWFTYELRVRDWLRKNGFEVQHLSSNRSGDGGVDIQASRGDENFLIQCKYWKKHKVGEGKIREMLGTLKTFPDGSTGVLVSCNELTGPARKLASEYGIQFIENLNFLDEIKFEL